MPVQRGYRHPYTNLRSTPDLCPDFGAKKRRRTDGLSVASTMDDTGGVGLWMGGQRTEVQVACKPAVPSRRTRGI